MIADFGIFEIFRQNLTGDYVLERNNLNKTYYNLLKNDYEINYKRYPKRLLNEIVPAVIFSRPPAQRSYLNNSTLPTFKQNPLKLIGIIRMMLLQSLKQRNFEASNFYS